MRPRDQPNDFISAEKREGWGEVRRLIFRVAVRNENLKT